LFTREEIIAAIREAEARLDRLEPAIKQRLAQPLPTGTWTVHDAVCHLAADSNAVPRFLDRIEKVRTGQPTRPPGFNMDAHNEANIAQRRGLPLDDVLREVHQGFDNDVAQVEALPADFLTSDVPNFRGELTPASDQIRFTAAGHPNLHLDDIEAALAQA
jgi:hypothetical protein